MNSDLASTAAIAHSLIQKIDSGEADLFLEQSSENNDEFTYRFFNDDGNAGVFASFPYNGMLRVQISFSEDTQNYTDVIADMLLQSYAQSGLSKASVWLRNEDRSIIHGLQSRIEFNRKGIDNSHYASVEYIMPRGYPHQRGDRALTVRPYDADRIDTYLRMLDESMDFMVPPPAYAQSRERFVEEFAQLQRRGSFEAFWENDELAGLYWRSGAEITVLAVALKWQRKGVGTCILSRAIDVIMEKTDAPYAYLYCVDWNRSAQLFYDKYGMVRNGHSYVLSIG